MSLQSRSRKLYGDINVVGICGSTKEMSALVFYSWRGPSKSFKDTSEDIRYFMYSLIGELLLLMYMNLLGSCQSCGFVQKEDAFISASNSRTFLHLELQA